MSTCKIGDFVSPLHKGTEILLKKSNQNITDFLILKSYLGPNNVWLCVMGQRAQGSSDSCKGGDGTWALCAQ